MLSYWEETCVEATSATKMRSTQERLPLVLHDIAKKVVKHFLPYRFCYFLCTSVL